MDKQPASPPVDTTPSRNGRLRLVSITTTALSGVNLQRGQLSFLRTQGVEVIAIAAPGEALQELGDREKIEVIAVPMAREIQPLQDLVSLVRLWRVLRQVRPDVVNAGTPKAGLIGMVAAWLAGVPVRIYTQRGLRLETCRGFKSRLLTWTERLACFCAHRVVFVSHSLRSASILRGLVRDDKAVVIGDGSSNGVDAERFQRRPSREELDEFRAEIGLPKGAPVIGFVGRLTRDKGIEELCAAFKRLRQNHPSAHLLIVGDYESGDPVDSETVSQLAADPNVIITGFVEDTSKYYHLMTVLAFPSHREGFPNVPLEAACAGIPAVGFQATGTVDAIQHQRTGTIVPKHDVEAFATAVDEYLDDPRLRERHGEEARRRAENDFAPRRVWDGLLALYRHEFRSSTIFTEVTNATEQVTPMHPMASGVTEVIEPAHIKKAA